jgi:hypothetical protein
LIDRTSIAVNGVDQHPLDVSIVIAELNVPLYKRLS